MRCTRCGSATRVGDSRPAEVASGQKRRDVKRTVGEGTNYVIRRRHCVDDACGQVYWSVEIPMSASRSTRRLAEPSPA